MAKAVSYAYLGYGHPEMEMITEAVYVAAKMSLPEINELLFSTAVQKGMMVEKADVSPSE